MNTTDAPTNVANMAGEQTEPSAPRYPHAEWRLLLEPEPRTGAWNMALDETIMDAVAAGDASTFSSTRRLVCRPWLSVSWRPRLKNRRRRGTSCARSWCLR